MQAIKQNANLPGKASPPHQQPCICSPWRVFWSNMLLLSAELGFDPDHPYDTEICKTFEEYMCVSTLGVWHIPPFLLMHPLILLLFYDVTYIGSFVWFNWLCERRIGEDFTVWTRHLRTNWVRCVVVPPLVILARTRLLIPVWFTLFMQLRDRPGPVFWKFA